MLASGPGLIRVGQGLMFHRDKVIASLGRSVVGAIGHRGDHVIALLG